MGKAMMAARRGLALALCAMAFAGQARAQDAGERGYGARFDCAGAMLPGIEREAEAMLSEAGVPRESWEASSGPGGLSFRLLDARASTLGLASRWGLGQEAVELPGAGEAKAASKAEIFMAMMSGGRERVFSGRSCSAKVWLREARLRQMAAARAASVAWDWPDGGPARWNGGLWDRGTPKGGMEAAPAALSDAFANQPAYSMGCYTATKLVFARAWLDAYGSAGDSDAREALAALASDGEPLVGVEPGMMWRHEQDWDPGQGARPGKILAVLERAEPESFVPGDWVYILNTDKESSAYTGYEGSNAVYLGGGRFDDYYADNSGSYGYREKVAEVWQWRNGVFSRSRDGAKAKPLSERDYQRLGRSPAEGGLVMPWRAYPEPVEGRTKLWPQPLWQAKGKLGSAEGAQASR